MWGEGGLNEHTIIAGELAGQMKGGEHTGGAGDKNRGEWGTQTHGGCGGALYSTGARIRL